MKRPVTLLIVVLLATLFLSACGCPANLTAPGAGEVERSVMPAPEQSVPMHTFPSAHQRITLRPVMRSMKKSHGNYIII